MTHPADLRADILRTVATCAADIIASLQGDDIPIELSIAIAACVLGTLIDELPTERRASFLQAYTSDLLRPPRLDA